MEDDFSIYGSFCAIIGAIVAIVFSLLYIRGKQTPVAEEWSNKERSKNGERTTSNKRKSKISFTKNQKFQYNHPWLASALKMHGANILDLDFSPNNKYLVSCAEDRSIILWHVKDFDKKEHRSSRGNVELDHARQVKFSPDAKALVTCLNNGNVVRVVKLGKKDDGSVSFQTAIDFKKETNVDIRNVGISATGKFIMAYYSDTTVRIFNLKGDVLTTLDTRQSYNTKGAVSPCGRFIASAGFTPDVKVWEVCFDKSGNFHEVKRAFELKGHSAGVYDMSFSDNTQRYTTVLCCTQFDVEYKLGEDARLLLSVSVDRPGANLIALSPDAQAVALATGNTVCMYDTAVGRCHQVFEHCVPDEVTAMAFDKSSRYLTVAGGKHIDVFYNVVGFKATIEDMEEKKRKTENRAFKERLTEQIQEARDLLKSLGEAI